MPHRTNVAYQYDGSFHGLLTCVFESYQRREIPDDILSPESIQTSLLPIRVIETDDAAARRVLTSIPKKICGEALDFVRKGYLTCLPRKEWHLLMFLRLGFHYGPIVMTMLANEALTPLFKAVKFLENESHLSKEFLRFSDNGEALTAQIEPKNRILPTLAQHFCERFPEERFLIHDLTHKEALVYQPYDFAILPLEELALPPVSGEEQFYRSLWKHFYNVVEVKPRHNEKCRRNHMPKHYWKHMTEFQAQAERPPAPEALKQLSGKGADAPGCVPFQPGVAPAKASLPPANEG